MGIFIIRSPYTPYSIYLSGTIWVKGFGLGALQRLYRVLQYCIGLAWGLGFGICVLRLIKVRDVGCRVCLVPFLGAYYNTDPRDHTS